MNSLELKKADRVEVLTLMDNYADVLLENTDVVTRRPVLAEGRIHADTLVAEHGLSLLVTVYSGGQGHTILFDTGYSSIGVPHNMAQLGVDLGQIEAVVLSHGHMDHTGALYELLDKLPKGIPLVVHPDALRFPRYLEMPDGTKVQFPKKLDGDAIDERGVTLVESKGPSLIADETVMITGEIDRATTFEKGMPNALMEQDGKLVQDPISDDQALVINLGEQGLVIIAGCAHAGIINTVMFAGKITGIQKVHAVLGGFHLSGPTFEPALEETIIELKKMAPEIIVPMHCTGWKAIKRFSEEFRTSFILNAVGSKFTLSSV
ncbi:MAG: MBL fold metallo-hydrolase [Deltaproteobacteria bacterium]|nr:MBL fold metallo-hydrolase [Deltaproteobacteria bacterium]